MLLPADDHRTINALQRAAHIVLRKSIREGFGPTVAEALWKGKHVIGGDTGGIRLQVVDYHTGFRVNRPEGAAAGTLHAAAPQAAAGDGAKGAPAGAQQLPAHPPREYLTLIHGLLNARSDRIELL